MVPFIRKSILSNDACFCLAHSQHRIADLDWQKILKICNTASSDCPYHEFPGLPRLQNLPRKRSLEVPPGNLNTISLTQLSKA